MKETTTYSKQVIEIADYIFKYPDKKMSEVLSYFVKKCRKDKRTIERYVKKAKQYNNTLLQKQQQVKDKVLVAEAEKSVKSAIISRNKSLEILSKIAEGSARKVPSKIGLVDGKEKPVSWSLEYPNDKERVLAIQQLAKMEGWEAAKEVNLNNSLSVMSREDIMGEIGRIKNIRNGNGE